MDRTPDEAAAVRVTIRYFAGARAAAGRSDEGLTLGTGATVQDLVEALTGQHGPAMARVLAACTFLIDETAGGRERTLADGAQVDVLPPFAGG